ncbi:hypothetical protein DFH94DRAFT_111658 [Russula ochroleuca]|jgi:hypothetical protein|uniref:Uncharacterized protein n=1 Tax=Russula ochroleuca TaxID=152965 RepID=A0A9P5MS10_9AGAM|nr:hypothetical protein DFH94DRAFT_111658 [Russula ochroleuca]
MLVDAPEGEAPPRPPPSLNPTLAVIGRAMAIVSDSAGFVRESPFLFLEINSWTVSTTSSLLRRLSACLFTSKRPSTPPSIASLTLETTAQMCIMLGTVSWDAAPSVSMPNATKTCSPVTPPSLIRAFTDIYPLSFPRAMSITTTRRTTPIQETFQPSCTTSSTVSLIWRRCCVVWPPLLPHAGERRRAGQKTHGNVITFSQDIAELCSTLPHLPERLDVIVVRKPGARDQDFRVQKDERRSNLTLTMAGRRR